MKLLMAARYPVGGIRTFLRYVYSRSVFADCTITLLAPGDDLADFLAKYIPTERLKIRSVSSDTRALLSAIRTTLRKEKFDLLHSHGLTTGVVGEIARIGTRVPHLMTMHDVFLPTTFRGMRGRMQQLALNLVIHRCDAIHAVSEDCAKNFTRYLPLVRKSRVHPILNGIDTEAILNAVPVDAHATLGLPPGIQLIGFFGRFMAQKGFRTLVDSVEILASTRKSPTFKVVTFGWGGFIREDFQYVERKGLSDYFVQHPATDEPYSWMRAMNVVAMPSRWEACGLVAMEALVAGVPIVGTNCIGLREVLAGTPATAISPEDPMALAAAIEGILVQGNSVDPFLEYQAEAATRFSAENASQEIRRLYDIVSTRAPSVTN